MTPTHRPIRQRLGEILVESRVVTPDQVRQALDRQAATGEMLGDALVQLKFATENDIVEAVCRQTGLPYLNAANYCISKEALALIPTDFALEHQILPLDKIGGFLLLAVSGDVPPGVLEDIERRTSLKPCLYVSASSQIVAAIRKHSDRSVLPAGRRTAAAGAAAGSDAKSPVTAEGP